MTVPLAIGLILAAIVLGVAIPVAGTYVLYKRMVQGPNWGGPWG
jgi:ABC-type Mn2+/Zn2+ transport system permease subunit